MSLTSVSFVLPMYNEKAAIGDNIKKLTSFAEGLSSDYEIIVVDDASSDGSLLIVEKLAEENPRIKLLRLPKNTKFGGALARGIKSAQKEVIVYTDSDLPVGFEDIKAALSLIDGCDIVTGRSKVRKGETLKRVIMSDVYNFLIQFLFRPNIKDINSGFKIYRRKVFEGAEFISESPFIDVEIFIKAMRKKFTVKEYPLIFKERKSGKSYISRPAVVLKTMADMIKFFLHSRP